ncbi:hypothetical protein RIF29_21648 [Crotalaria pallida]|uniref:Uncharacterized protein n=1 Tax=Crotalaria pallida TaxID=3830 RepID=A0AAN9F4P9_CROPI
MLTLLSFLLFAFTFLFPLSHCCPVTAAKVGYMSGTVPEGIRPFLQAPSPFRPSSSACYLRRRGTHPLDRRSSVLVRSQQRGSDLIVWVDTTISSSKQACWWQPSIPEEAALWDEDWEKFEDEGFANDLTFDTKNASSKPKPVVINGEQSFNEDHSVGSPMSANGKHESSTNGDYTVGDKLLMHTVKMAWEEALLIVQLERLL